MVHGDKFKAILLIGVAIGSILVLKKTSTDQTIPEFQNMKKVVLLIVWVLTAILLFVFDNF